MLQSQIIMLTERLPTDPRVCQVTINHRVIYGPQDLSHSDIIKVLGIEGVSDRSCPDIPSRSELIIRIETKVGEPVDIDCSALITHNSSREKLQELEGKLRVYGISVERVLALIKA